MALSADRDGTTERAIHPVGPTGHGVAEGVAEMPVAERRAARIAEAVGALMKCVAEGRGHIALGHRLAHRSADPQSIGRKRLAVGNLGWLRIRVVCVDRNRR